MARVILDAGVAIALRSPQDPHAEAARAIVLAAEELVIHPVTLAEALVAPARAGVAARVRDHLIDGLGVVIWDPDAEEPLRVAELRAATRIALPDCYVLQLAEQSGHALASFDHRLLQTARDRGVAIAEA